VFAAVVHLKIKCTVEKVEALLSAPMAVFRYIGPLRFRDELSRPFIVAEQTYNRFLLVPVMGRGQDNKSETLWLIVGVEVVTYSADFINLRPGSVASPVT
jgi:hypothetical protein